jgi:hypothetical protein
MRAPTDARTRWGLPDWAVGGEYPAPGASTRRWGWEFLRRRADYRALWLANEHRAEPTSDGPLTAMVDDYEAARRQYSMSRVVDPRAKLSEWDLGQFLNFRPFGYGVGYRDQDTERADERARKKAIMFDLRQPLAPQIEVARDHLERLQGELGGAPAASKNRVGNWPLLLRVLDARECGATFATIAPTLWPGLNKAAQSARDLHKAAQAVQKRAPFLL